MTNLTNQELLAIIDRSLKATAAQFKSKKPRAKQKPAARRRKPAAKKRRAR